ncbi:transcriptional repressor LexA [Anoxybacillus sp. LAT_38]|uniref:transcriptional repressor LexA n=1 Tax=Anoxybacillus sp. LAT_26 TaxID=2862719 RepID=UPI001EEBF1A9|nr:transcriptional repressor LexA [Anoxybacillus sp. LAT_26]MCG6183285.1 transcriptional repressor LexA [Anoxybacillus sp. LAT_26]MCG6199178.1 transcriptional repressor LexA [Anoxybacillus sp. LAT_38]
MSLQRYVGEKIKEFRLKRGMSQEELADLLGTTKQTVSRYETGERKANQDILFKLSEIFNVSIDDFFPSKKETVLKTVNLTFTKLPIVGTISCGNGVVAYEDIEGYEEVPTSWLNGGEYFFVRAKGDSMINARIMDGDLLLIRRQEDVESGEIAAVLIDDEIVLKRVYKTNGTIILQSENPKYQPIVVQKSDMKNVRIIGKLKKVVLNF